jgi:hypothetical protein
LRRRGIFRKNDLIVSVRYVERRALRVDLDYRAVRVAARRHAPFISSASSRAGIDT